MAEAPGTLSIYHLIFLAFIDQDEIWKLSFTYFSFPDGERKIVQGVSVGKHARNYLNLYNSVFNESALKAVLQNSV
jgi:hypothetical protein